MLHLDSLLWLDLKGSLPIDSDDAIHSLHRSLLAAHERTVTELGRGFYRNHTEYVSVAKEAVRFEQDLAAMQAMMAQLKGFSEVIVGPRAAKIANGTYWDGAKGDFIHSSDCA
jgi:hypothetical protein